MKILVVDDDEVDVMTVKRAFRRHGLAHQIHVCVNGLEALDYLEAVEDLPDIVLLDINMPRMGGLELLTELRAHERLRALHVLMLTTSKADHDVRAAYELNVAGYIVKPVSFQEFVGTVGILHQFWSRCYRPQAA